MAVVSNFLTAAILQFQTKFPRITLYTAVHRKFDGSHRSTPRWLSVSKNVWFTENHVRMTHVMSHASEVM